MLGFILVTGNYKWKRVGLFIVCTLMISVAGLRHGYIDTRAYRQVFEALDAGAMGRLLITSNIPGCREAVLDGENGYL